MEGEELYDSLDEASNNSSTSSTLKDKEAGGDVKTTDSSGSVFTIARDESATTIITDEIREVLDIEKLIPLYRGDVTKKEISFRASKITSNETQNQRKNRFVPSTITTNIATAIPVKPNKSYLEIFHSRIGYPGGKSKTEFQDTTRRIFGDTHRTLSDSSIDKEEFVDARDQDADSGSDTTSFYLNRIEEEQLSKYSNQQDLSKTTLSLLSPRSSISEFKSVSQFFETPSCSKLANANRKPLRKVLPIPIMGKLGPDSAAIQEKLERRKKQLLYGQKASARNRLKILETSILRNLKNEIEKANELDENESSICMA